MAASTLREALALGSSPPQDYIPVTMNGQPIGVVIRGFYPGSDGDLHITRPSGYSRTLPVKACQYFLFANGGDVAVEADSTVTSVWAVP